MTPVARRLYYVEGFSRAAGVYDLERDPAEKERELCALGYIE